MAVFPALLLFNRNGIRSSEVASAIITSSIDPSEICIGNITDDRPRIQNMLNMFEPMTFPMARSTFPLYAAIPDAASSGRDVPIATTVSAIIPSLTPNSSAISTALDTIS